MKLTISTAICLSMIATTGALAQPGGTSTLFGGDADTGFLFAPDFKFTDVNGKFANLAGGYGGWVVDKKFLIGGGVYTLTNGGSSTDMTYGGGVVEYFVNQGSLVNISVRGLVGGGKATLGSSFPALDLGRGPRLDGRGFPGSIPIPVVNDLFGRFGDGLGRDLDDDDFDFRASSTNFFVAEPEVNVLLNISEKLRFSVGGGYRFIGGAGRLQERLDGFTANVALKFSFF